jgi:hypothetical protein
MCMNRSEYSAYKAGQLFEGVGRSEDRKHSVTGQAETRKPSRGLQTTAGLVATLPGPSKTITVEPIEVPAPAEEPTPAEPSEPAKEPDKEPAPAR